MRPVAALSLAALLFTGCAVGPGATSARATPEATAASDAPSASVPAAPSIAPPTASPTNQPATSPVSATEYTADDEKIATLVRAGADEAIPQLKALNGMDPGKLEELFLPLATWIADQRTGIDAYTASSCTAGAVALFNDGLDAYDSIRETFMGWRDWGAHGHPFSRGAPPQVVAVLEEALAELEAGCAT